MMSDAIPEVEHLLSSARAGSAAAMGQLFDGLRDYLLAVANRRVDAALRSKGGASDIVQETFLEAQRDFGRFSGTTEDEFKAWLVRLLVNNASNFARHYKATGKRQVTREVGLPADTPSGPAGGNLAGETPTPSVEMMAGEQQTALHQAIARLPSDYQQVITLRNRDDLAFAEIAAIMGRSENATRKLWFRAIEHLQREMDAST